MKHRTASVIWAFLMMVALAVVAMGQDPATAPSTQSDPAATKSEPAKKSDADMPATASPLALIALMGVGSLGAGATAHRFARR